MPERMTWQVKAYEWQTDQELEDDLGDWEPFAADDVYIFLKRQTIVEGEKSSVGHELSFEARYDRPFDQDNDPED